MCCTAVSPRVVRGRNAERGRLLVVGATWLRAAESIRCVGCEGGVLFPASSEAVDGSMVSSASCAGGPNTSIEPVKAEASEELSPKDKPCGAPLATNSTDAAASAIDRIAGAAQARGVASA